MVRPTARSEDVVGALSAYFGGQSDAGLMKESCKPPWCAGERSTLVSNQDSCDIGARCGAGADVYGHGEYRDCRATSDSDEEFQAQRSVVIDADSCAAEPECPAVVPYHGDSFERGNMLFSGQTRQKQSISSHKIRDFGVVAVDRVAADDRFRQLAADVSSRTVPEISHNVELERQIKAVEQELKKIDKQSW